MRARGSDWCPRYQPLRHTAQILGGGSQQELVLRTASTAQSQSIELQDALQVREEHFNLLAILTAPGSVSETLWRLAQIQKRVYPPQQMIRGHVLFEVKAVEEPFLIACLLAHHPEVPRRSCCHWDIGHA
jgi:hypothetical protein